MKVFPLKGLHGFVFCANKCVYYSIITWVAKGVMYMIFTDTTDLMVRGHEIWLEMAGSHGHAGTRAEVYVKWGQNMLGDGLLRKENLAALLVAPSGEKQDLAPLNGGSDYYKLRFTPQEEGYYHIVAMNTGSYVTDIGGRITKGTRREYPEAVEAICYIQYAQIFAAIGHDLKGMPKYAETVLEIIPEMWRHWHAGDEIALSLAFRGWRAGGVAVDVACAGPEGYRQWQETTGQDGRFNVIAREPGRYLVVARHLVSEAEKTVYDKLSFTATLSFMVTK